MEQMNRLRFAWPLAGMLLISALAGVTFYYEKTRGSPVDPAARSQAGSPAMPLQPAEVVVDPAMLQNLGIRTATVEPRTMTAAIRTTGYVNYDERRVTQVNARISGWVQKLYVVYVGEEVRRGQPLLDIYSPELMLTQEDYIRSRELAKHADSMGAVGIDAAALMSAAEARLRLFGISPSEIRKLDRRGSASQDIPLEAPVSGFVTNIKVVEGSYAGVGTGLYTIADISSVWVYADIYERELPMAQVGERAVVFSDALPGKSFQGRVTYIYPEVNPQTRTVKVRLEFANPGNQLRPGMYVGVTLHSDTPREILAVPAEAVLNSGIRRVVIVDLGNGHFMPRVITRGPESEGYISVLSGLKEGERVVTSGQFLIDSESNLREALNAMALSAGAGSGPAMPNPKP
jgi:RND family efflux transporter MFP subunit